MLLSVAIGVYFAKRAGVDIRGMFVAGRSLPWYVAGTSMVATTFSADTPLLVSGLVRSEGIHANWIWWSAAPAALATVFFFAHLWRRLEVLTEIEFIELRYGASRAKTFYRFARAIYDGLLGNCISMSVVILAASKLIATLLGLTDTTLIAVGAVQLSSIDLALLTLGLVAVVYTTTAGLYGVVYTDLLQFCLAITGSIILAWLVYADLGGLDGFAESVRESAAANGQTLEFFPSLDSFSLQTVTFLILVSVSWISYAPGAGLLVQRILATRSERDAVLSVYWYAFVHYVVRSWPWIIVSLATLVYFPVIGDPESAYPNAIRSLMPAGAKGIMVASLLAAFMSTLDTHMNWGASYLVNDVYEPYLIKGRSRSHYVWAARACMILLVTFAFVLAANLDSIVEVVKFLLVMLSGNAFLVVARWYWWRITVWSEIASLACSLALGVSLIFLLPDQAGEDWFAVRLFVNSIGTAFVCFCATLLTSRWPLDAQVVEFYRRVRIRGPGWERVRNQCGLHASPTYLGSSFIAWATSVTLLYAALFGIGYVLLGQWTEASVALLLAFVCLPVLMRQLAGFIRLLAEPRAAEAEKASAVNEEIHTPCLRKS